MDLQQIKGDIAKAGFSREGMALINAELDKAIGRGKLEKEEKEKIQGIMDLEIEAAKIVADANKEMAAALNEFADGIEAAIIKAAEGIGEFGTVSAVAPPKPDNAG